MNRQNYRAAFDAVDFSPDFEERTLQKLAAMRHASEKEQNKMSMNRTKKITLLAAAAVALLAVTVSAAVLWLTPAQVAEELNDPMLAEAFQSEAAVILNETQTVGDYTVTLGGLVSGTGLSRWYEDAEETRTYAVVSVSRTVATVCPALTSSPTSTSREITCPAMVERTVRSSRSSSMES